MGTEEVDVELINYSCWLDISGAHFMSGRNGTDGKRRSKWVSFSSFVTTSHCCTCVIHSVFDVQHKTLTILVHIDKRNKHWLSLIKKLREQR